MAGRGTYDNQTYPIDIQCAGQAIDTLTLFSDRDKEALPLAVNVANWTIDNMQDPRGHFYYRHHAWIIGKTPMLHWGQGTMFKALSHLLTALRNDTEGQRSIAPVSREAARRK